MKFDSEVDIGYSAGVSRDGRVGGGGAGIAAVQKTLSLGDGVRVGIVYSGSMINTLYVRVLASLSGVLHSLCVSGRAKLESVSGLCEKVGKLAPAELHLELFQIGFDVALARIWSRLMHIIYGNTEGTNRTGHWFVEHGVVEHVGLADVFFEFVGFPAGGDRVRV